MTVGNIIKSVRWCIDEESLNMAGLAAASAFDFDGDVTDTGLMNNIIRNKIPAALRWVCLYAPAEQLSGGSTATAGQTGGGTTPTTIDIIKEETEKTATNNLIKLDVAFIRLLRVRGKKWHRAVMGESVLREDSGEYLQLHDENGAEATIDRPQAALINTKQKSVEVWPASYTSNGSSVSDKFTVTYVVTPSVSELENLDKDETEVGIPPMVETSFVYYLAYLLLSAYGDARAKSMFEIATLNLGRTDDKQRQ